MFVVAVIPLVRGTHVDTLSYYTNSPYTPGTIISIPLRNQTRQAIVTDCRGASTAKAALRAATFTLRKLPEQEEVTTLPPAIIRTATELMNTVPATYGALLHNLLPREIRHGKIPLEVSGDLTAANETPTTSLLQGTYEDRFRGYRSRIRETFAHRGSVLFVVPTSAEVERARANLESGIEKRVVTFSSAYTLKKLKSAYDKFHDVSHAKLIITTPSHAFLDRLDITDIIIDQSRSRAYKSRFRPYLDVRECLITLAKVTKRNVVLGDLVPRTEDEHKRREEFYATEGEAPKRITLPGKLSILKYDTTRKASAQFELFTPTLKKNLIAAYEAKENVFMYAARRGISPVVACVDCGFIFRCPDSGAPYSLFKTVKDGEEQRWFLASASGKRIRAADTCEHCGSWRLRERGIGIQHIADALKNEFPQIPVILFDHTTAKTMKRATQLIGDFYDMRGGILLGTAMTIPYLERPVAHSVITSLDAARSVPTWRAEEELFSLLLTLREKSEKSVLLQTRQEPDEVLKLAQNGQAETFYNQEITLREQLAYPPFSYFIHLTLQGQAPVVKQLEADIAERLKDFNPRFYSAPTTTPARTTRYGLIRLKPAQWPNPPLMDILRSLPPQVRIEINPDRII